MCVFVYLQPYQNIHFPSTVRTPGGPEDILAGLDSFQGLFVSEVLVLRLGLEQGTDEIEAREVWVFVGAVLRRSCVYEELSGYSTALHPLPPWPALLAPRHQNRQS